MPRRASKKTDVLDVMEFKVDDMVAFRTKSRGPFEPGLIMKVLLYKYDIRGNDGKTSNNVEAENVTKLVIGGTSSSSERSRKDRKNYAESSEDDNPGNKQAEVGFEDEEEAKTSPMVTPKKRRTGPASSKAKKPVEKGTTTPRKRTRGVQVQRTPPSKVRQAQLKAISAEGKKALVEAASPFIGRTTVLPWYEIKLNNPETLEDYTAEELEFIWEDMKDGTELKKLIGQVESSKAAEDTDEEAPEKEEALHHRSVKKKRRSFFTRDEVKALMTGVAQANPKGQCNSPSWRQLKDLYPDSLAARTCVDLKDKFRNLSKTGLAKSLVFKIQNKEDIDVELDTAVFKRGGARADMHYRHEKKSKRNPWAQEEVACLEAGIHEYGNAWTKIKEAYPENLGERTSLDLKDKWRNMERLKAKVNME